MDQPERLTRKFTISCNQRQSFLYLISFNNTKTKNPSFDKKTSVKEQKNKITEEKQTKKISVRNSIKKFSLEDDIKSATLSDFIPLKTYS